MVDWHRPLGGLLQIPYRNCDRPLGGLLQVAVGARPAGDASQLDAVLVGGYFSFGCPGNKEGLHFCIVLWIRKRPLANGERLQSMPEKPDNVVFLKAYRNVAGICQSLKDAGMYSDSVAVANCSRDNEAIYKDLSTLPQQTPNYWTLIIAKQKDHGPKRSS